MAEPVDRLKFVADEEQLLGVELVDDLALQPVRVLELVHHHGPEAKPLVIANGLVVSEQVAGTKLEILEVERRLAVLRGLIRKLEATQEILE